MRRTQRKRRLKERQVRQQQRKLARAYRQMAAASDAEAPLDVTMLRIDVVDEEGKRSGITIPIAVE